MNLTRDKIAELKRLAEKATPGPWMSGANECLTKARAVEICKESIDATPTENTIPYFFEVFLENGLRTALVGNGPTSWENAEFIAAFNPATASALLALAERALESQGQALPELIGGRSAISLCDEYGSGVEAFTADQMRAYARLYASQLALPAGPVPEGFAAGVEASAKWIEARMNDFIAQHGSEDVETGSLEFGRGAHADAKQEYVGELQEIAEGIRTIAAPSPAVAQHSDDIAVDRFAVAMKEKLAKAREKGRSGWQECDPAELSYMLRDHVEKGDPRDVANFCMFLWSLGKPISDTVLPISGYALPKVESPAVAQPVAEYFLNTAAEGEAPHYQQVAKEHRADPDVVALYTAPQPVADEREASDAYFKARHPMLDTTANRNVFSAGFRAALCQPAEEKGGA